MRLDPFHLVPSHFPQNTSSAFEIDDILRHGVLPLGTKTHKDWFRTEVRLNVGFLHPTRRDVRALCQRLRDAQSPFKRFAFFKISTEQFVKVVREVYGVDENWIEKHGSTLHPLLKEHFKMSPSPEAP